MVYLLKYCIPFILAVRLGLTLKCINNKCKNNNTINNMEGFIVGGSDTTIEHFPHAVCLFHYPMYKFFCGSSVLNQHILLTAAHCIEEDGSFGMDAYAGHENVEKVKIIRKVNRFVVHKEYELDSTKNDIALLFMDEALPIGRASPIKRVVISLSFPVDVTDAEVSGWGYVNDVTRQASSILKYTKQKVIPLDECADTYFYEWLPGMLCAGDPLSEVDRPSKGDSGGALITKDFQQIGVVSFTMGEHPGLVFYTNVSHYYNWIKENADSNICLGQLRSGCDSTSDCTQLHPTYQYV